MCGDSPQYVDCLVTEGPRIVYVGDLNEAGDFLARPDKKEVDKIPSKPYLKLPFRKCR